MAIKLRDPVSLMSGHVWPFWKGHERSWKDQKMTCWSMLVNVGECWSPFITEVQVVVQALLRGVLHRFARRFLGLDKSPTWPTWPTHRMIDLFWCSWNPLWRVKIWRHYDPLEKLGDVKWFVDEVTWVSPPTFFQNGEEAWMYADLCWFLQPYSYIVSRCFICCF